MSAGTIFALSADRIMLDYFSCLGPIDPQIEKEGRLVPALAYLSQFERLNAKAEAGALTTAEYALLSKLDRDQELDWLRDRSDVQAVLSRLLKCSVSELSAHLGDRPADPPGRLLERAMLVERKG